MESAPGHSRVRIPFVDLRLSMFPACAAHVSTRQSSWMARCVAFRGPLIGAVVVEKVMRGQSKFSSKAHLDIDHHLSETIDRARRFPSLAARSCIRASSCSNRHRVYISRKVRYARLPD
jgi:hypothetical protein